MFAGIGGPRMMAQGFESHYPMEKLSVRGYVEVLRSYCEIMRHPPPPRAGACSQERPDLFIGVDSPDFNLGLERRLKARGHPDRALREPVDLGLARLAHPGASRARSTACW